MVGPLCWPSVSTSRPWHTFPSVLDWLRSMSTSLTPNMPAPFPRALLTASRRRVHEHRCCEGSCPLLCWWSVSTSRPCHACVHRPVCVPSGAICFSLASLHVSATHAEHAAVYTSDRRTGMKEFTTPWCYCTCACACACGCTRTSISCG